MCEVCGGDCKLSETEEVMFKQQSTNTRSNIETLSKKDIQQFEQNQVAFQSVCF